MQVNTGQYRKAKHTFRNKVNRFLLSAYLRMKKTKNLSTYTQTLDPWTVWKTYNILQRCNDVPYEVFKKCSVDKAYHLLKINLSDKIPDYILEIAWLHIYSEFCEISEDENMQAIIADLAQLYYIESRIIRTSELAKLLLKSKCDPDVRKALRDMGYAYKFTEETYLDDVEELLGDINSLRATEKLLRANMLDRATNNEQETEANKYAVHDDKINMIERAFKIPVDTSKLSAQMYAIKIRDLRRYIIANTKNTGDA